jgi:hypothetical protein
MAESARDDRWLLILQVVFDETGLGQTEPDQAFIFAGFLGSARQWEAFVHAWKPLLEKPPILRAKGFKNTLRRKRNNKRMLGFTSVLRECEGLRRVSVTIPNKAYKIAVLDEIPKWQGRLDTEALELLDNPYYFGFYVMMMQVLLPMVQSLGDKAELEVIYDENIQEAEKVKSGYREFLAQTPEAKQLRREPRSENDDKFMPLLAADLLAWHMRRDFSERQQGREHQDTVWDALDDLPKYPPLVLNEAELWKIVAWDELEKRLR